MRQGHGAAGHVVDTGAMCLPGLGAKVQRLVQDAQQRGAKVRLRADHPGHLIQSPCSLAVTCWLGCASFGAQQTRSTNSRCPGQEQAEPGLLCCAAASGRQPAAAPAGYQGRLLWAHRARGRRAWHGHLA